MAGVRDRVDRALAGIDPASIDSIIVPIDEWDEFCRMLEQSNRRIVTYCGIRCRKMAISVDFIVKIKPV